MPKSSIHLTLILGLSLFSYVPSQGPSIVQASEVDFSKTADDYQSEFDTLFRDWDDFDRAVEATSASLEESAQWLSQNISNADELADYLEHATEIEEATGRLFFYAVLRRNIDTTSNKAQSAYDNATSLRSQANAISSIVGGVIGALDDEDLTLWQSTEDRLLPYALMINSARSTAEYRLDENQERIIGNLQRSKQLSPDVWTSLMDSSVVWPKNSSGAILDAATYRGLRRQFPSSERASGMTAFLSQLSDLSETFGLLYTRRIEGDLAIAQMRGFTRGAHAWWQLTEDIPVESTEVMIESVREAKDILQDYVRARAKALGLGSVRYADLFITPQGATRSFTVGQTFNNIVDMYELFGSERVEQMKGVMNSSIMHLSYSDTKSAEWGIVPGVGGSLPHLRMSYSGSYADSRRLVAGMASLMGFYYRPKDVVFSADDSAISVDLYTSYLMYDQFLARETQDPLLRRVYLISSGDRIMRSLFLNVIQAELDMRVEQLVMNGNIPTGADISAIYMELLQSYFENVDVDPSFANEWMINFVPFLNYAHHNWPASLAASVMLLEQSEAGVDVSKALFNQITKDGRSDRIYNVLVEAGIDLNTSKPYLAAGRRLKSIAEALTALHTQNLNN